MNLKPRDIVNRNGGPAEVLCVFHKLDPPLIFIVNKRSLQAEFVQPCEVEFVRRPTSAAP